MSHWHDTEIRISGGFLLLTAWFAVENGWRPLALVLGAAALHEGGHLLALRFCGAAVRRLRVTVFGAVMDTECGGLSYGRELAAVLAGPAANLVSAALLALPTRQVEGLYPFIGAHLVLGCFNLLPIRPLDGGRALELAAAWRFGPAAGEQVARIVGAVCALGLGTGLLLLVRCTGGNLWLLPAGAGLLLAGAGEALGMRYRN